MNTTPVLERAHGPASTDIEGHGPDTSIPGTGIRRSTSSHRRRPHTRLAVMIFALAALIVAVGGALVLEWAGDRDAERRAAIEELTGERDEALRSAATFEAELESLRTQAAELDGDLARRIAQLTELQRRMADASTARDEAMAAAAQLQIDLDAVRAQAGQAIADRDSLLDRFPINAGGDLADRNIAGDYSVELSRTYCSTNGTCRLPKAETLTIATTPEGYLRLRVPGLIDAGLLRAGAALHTVTDTTTTVNACDGAARPARITVTIFPGTEVIDADGGRRLASIGAAITVDAPATATCAATFAVYAAELTPR